MNNLWRIGQFLLLMVVLTSCSGAQMNLKEKEKILNWDTLEVYWNKYIVMDSLKAANDLYNYLIERLDIDSGDSGKAETVHNRMYNSLFVLHQRIKAHDSNAVNISFALLTIADGAFMEDLTTDIGDLIIIDPGMFLTQFKKHKYLIQNPKSILIPQIEDYDEDRDKARKKEEEEIIKRIDALKSVKIPDLNSLRDECIRILEKWIKEY